MHHGPLWVLLISCTAPHMAIAGAWTLPRDHLLTINGANVYHASAFYNVKGRKTRQPSYHKYEATQYLEYGLRDTLTIGSGTSYNSVSRRDSFGERQRGYALGDSELFLRHRVWNDDWSVLSLQGNVIVPSADGQNERPKIGGDKLSLATRAQYGRSFQHDGRWHYTDLAAGYVGRKGRPTDQWLAEATLGYTLSESWQIRPQFTLVHSRAKLNDQGFTQSSADNRKTQKISVAFAYKLSHEWEVSSAFYSDLRGKNAGAGKGLTLEITRHYECIISCSDKP